MDSRLSVEDRLDIIDLFNRYSYFVDDNDQEAWLDLFTPDGVFDVPGLMCKQGRDALRDVIRMVSEGSGGHWRHQLTNILAEPGDQPGTARVRFYGLVTDWRGEGHLSTFNNYHGELRKEGGTWRIVRLKALPTRVTVDANIPESQSN